MRCLILSIFQLLGACLAATNPATSDLTQLDNNAEVNLTVPSNPNLPLESKRPFVLGVPAPAAPYRIRQDDVFLTFYDYGAPLPPNPTRRLLHKALKNMTTEHGADSGEKVGQELVYSLNTLAVGGTLRFSVQPEASMTWGMCTTAATGVVRFLERWDNVEFAVDVDIGMDSRGKVGTAYLSRA